MTVLQEPYPGPSSATWEQDVSVGGEDALAEPATVAVAVSPQGITTVRDVPTTAAASNSIALPVTTSTTRAQRLLGRTPQRRRVTVVAHSANAAALHGAPVARCNVDGDMALSVGLVLGHGVPVPIESSGELWVIGIGADIVTASFWAEIDRG